MLNRFTPFLFVAFQTNILLASGGSGEAHFDQSMIFKLINFGLLLAILHFFAKKPVAGLLKGLLKSNQQKYTEAQEEQKEWASKLNEYKSKVDSLEKELSEMKEKAKKDIENERKAALEEAGNIADRIIEQSKKQSEQLVKNAKEQFENKLLEKAFEIAEGKVKDQIDSSARKDSIKQFISSIN